MSDPGYRAEHLIIPGLKHFVLETLEPAIGMLTGYEGEDEGTEEEKEEEKAAPPARGSGGGDAEALRKLMAAAKLRPRDATTYTSLARAVGRAVATKGAAASPSLKDFAIRSWKLAVQLAPARPSALRELAAALRAQGKEQAAERILARVAA